MTRTKGVAGRAPVAAAAACTLAATALLLSACGNANAPADEWVEPDDYRFTLSMFEGKCGETKKAQGSWAITVADGQATRVEPLNDAARTSSWIEGAPTIGELHDNALGVRKDGAYDVVDITYATDGPDAGRPTRIHYLERVEDDGGHESCNAIHGFVPAD